MHEYPYRTCAEIDLTPAGEPQVFRAALPEDLAAFVLARMGAAARAVVAALQAKG